MTKMNSPAHKRPASSKKRIAQAGARSQKGRSRPRHDGHKRCSRSMAETSQAVVTASKAKTVRLAASARRALEAARSFQAVTKIRGEAEGIRAYAKALNDWTLETEAVEIRV